MEAIIRDQEVKEGGAMGRENGHTQNKDTGTSQLCVGSQEAPEERSLRQLNGRDDLGFTKVELT